MPNPKPQSVDAYIGRYPEAMQTVLQRVRSTIRLAVPDADEVIDYNMPAFKQRGAVVLSSAGWKEHYSLYPCNAHVKAAFADELEPYKMSKGTVRLPFSQPVPVRLIERIAKFRAQEVAASRARPDAG